ncbi:alpha/beta-hydrolase [Aspergillus sclerotioniger CBS 115572]|uniref:Alpha/beta-hydrolase n=1 Tax=Aspergillus sclerotioniger CBS 115572 TaxID=1450535 RepID=A0A317XCX5_9EURO|nr:alpha/beta-hydrolase [Aspergillus sclerotioniger CBS 115572]PWY95981.1 alpha/beta-hydrolase [Aspergillus sclerotioniger CBS 115572]
MPPTILFVPGFWEGPTVFDPISTILTAHGFITETAILPSTGTTSPGNPSMADDIASVRAHLQKIVQRGEEVILVLHSAGGFLGSAAMEGLAKADVGSGGGVVKIVFLSGAVFPVGFEHQPLPFGVTEGGAMYCAQPEVLLLDDVPEPEKTKWLGVLKPQPAQGWDGIVPYAGWQDVPSVYLICEGDRALPVGLQEQLAGLAGSQVERCSAGHLPQVSQQERVVEVIEAAAVGL